MTLLFYLHAITQGWWAARLWSNKENSSSLCPESSRKSVALFDEEAAFQYNIFYTPPHKYLVACDRVRQENLVLNDKSEESRTFKSVQGSVETGDNAWYSIVTRDTLDVSAFHSPSAIILWKPFPPNQTEVM